MSEILNVNDDGMGLSLDEMRLNVKSLHCGRQRLHLGGARVHNISFSAKPCDHEKAYGEGLWCFQVGGRA